MFLYRKLLQVTSILVILPLLFSGFSMQPALAQGKDGLNRQVNPQTGKVSFLGPENGRALSASQALGISPFSHPVDPALALAKRFGGEFGLKSPERDLSQMKTQRAENGRITARYQQNYQGIPVMGGELIVNTNDNGDLYSMNGEVSPDLSLATQPTIDSEQAKETALQSMAKWYQKNAEDFLVSKPALWIYDESLLRPSTRPAELVWRMEVTPKDVGMPVRELVLVNAQSGSISLHFNQIDTAWDGTQEAKTPKVTDTVPTTLVSNSDGLDDELLTANASVKSAPALSGSATWYVATTGNDANDCARISTPCATINGAINKALAGDVIKIATGTYIANPQESIVDISKSITLSGGWNVSFSTQIGFSTLDAQKITRAVSLGSMPTGHISANLDRFILKDGNLQNAGGIYNIGTLTITNSSIQNNTAPGGVGGGIYNWGSLILNNTTISNNSSSHGGGIYNDSQATLVLNNSTVSSNSAAYGGGIFNAGGSIILKNTIIAGNSSTASGSDCNGTVSSAGYNLIGDTAGCSFTTGIGDLANVNAKLGALIGSLGYYPLQAGSPAIDAGNPLVPGSGGDTCLANDERGVARPVGARCDMGAYEYTVPGSATSLLIISGDEQHATPGFAFAVPLRVAALDSQGSPVPNVSITFTAPDSGASGIFTSTGTNATTVVTGADGTVTTSSFTANTLLGSFTIVAFAGGAGSVNFKLQNIVWYVATTGNDANDCHSPDTPCATINGVIGKAANGNMIKVAVGTYTGSGTEVVLINKNITLSGGWDASFATQSGISAIDGQGTRRGITVSSGIIATVEYFVMQNGTSSVLGNGGGGVSNSGTFTLINSTVIQNSASSYGGGGGGIYNAPSSIMIINNSTITGNTANASAYAQGGGIHNAINGTLTLNNSIVMGNTMGGIYNRGIMTLNNSSINNNDNNNGEGGGISNSFGTMMLNNTTISNNIAYSGAGIYSSGHMTVNNSTISYNNATMGIGGVNNNSSGGVFTMRNSIIANNTGINPDCNGYYVTSAGHNIVGNATSCNFPLASGDLINTDPKLGQLIGNPGFVPLLPNSPAIDAGDPATCLSTDQRGISRPQGSACDIGAFEHRGNSVIPTYIFVDEGTPQYIAKGGAAGTNLKAAVLDNNGDGVSGITVTFTAPASGVSAIFSNTGTNTTTVVTNADGLATAPTFSVNNLGGNYIIRATVKGVTSSADFQITNIGQIRTYTANHTTTLPGASLCDQTKPNCTNNADPYADAAHKYAIGTYGFYAAQFNRDSIDNHALAIISTVHYSYGYDNAFWNGSQMVYGDAHGYPLADDVVAHELTHGVTQYESNLMYLYQSGAINESLSDVFGEYYDQTNGLGNEAANVKWLMGEDISGMGAIRSMSNPPAYGDPDKMSSPYYDTTPSYSYYWDDGGVHTNSGVNNKAVYLMVDGDTFNGRTVTGIGWDKTAAIYYEANTNLLSSGADYSDLYYALQQACTNLIGQKGITSSDCTQVKSAIDAVEMNGQPVANYNTDAPLCTGGFSPRLTFADDLENGTGNWTFQNGTYPRWRLDSPYGQYSQSGNHSLYAYDVPAAVTDAKAQLTPLLISGNSYLHFAQAYEFEYDTSGNYDGGVLEYSTNGGSTWVDAGSMMDYNGYNGTVATGWSNPLKGKLGFVGSSHGYISTRLNLASLAGKTVKFRWRMGLDSYGAGAGWWVDNIQVYSCSNSTISGNVGIGGAILTYTDGGPQFVTADGGGNYSITVPTGWSGTVTPYKIGYAFTPSSKSYSNVQGNQTGQNYTTSVCPSCADKDTVGVFRPSNGLLYLKNLNITGFADVAINYGIASDYPVVGDWDGDGTATIGIYRGGKFYLRNSNTLGFADWVFPFGQVGDQPIAGDWNGDGIDTIGVYRPSNGQFLLRNSNDAGSADAGSFFLGNAGDVGIAGDWTNKGYDTVGVFRPSNGIIFLKNTNQTGFADIALNYGIPGDRPVIGDWNDDGIDTIGVYRNNTFYLRNSNSVGFADMVFSLGNPGDMPIAGDWDNLP